MQSEGLLKLATVNLTYDDPSQEFMFNNVKAIINFICTIIVTGLTNKIIIPPIIIYRTLMEGSPVGLVSFSL